MGRDISASGYVNAGVGVNVAGVFTIACWWRADAASGRLMSRWSASGNNHRFLLELGGGGVLSFTIMGSDISGQGVNGATGTSTGAWRHAAAVYVPSTSLTVYLDGVQDGINTTSIKAALSGNSPQKTLNFGADEGGASRHDGVIAECGFWDAALSAAEILGLAKGVSPRRVRPGSLKGYWPLYGVAYPEIDLSGQGNNATQESTAAAATHAPVGRIV